MKVYSIVIILLFDEPLFFYSFKSEYKRCKRSIAYQIVIEHAACCRYVLNGAHVPLTTMILFILTFNRNELTNGATALIVQCLAMDKELE